jgi:hypothetical protein
MNIQKSADAEKRNIIQWLLQGGLSFDSKCHVIGNEVLFSRQRRRVDLLVMMNSFHALEIKGDLDNLSKLPNQLIDYCETFDQVSVVTTPKYLTKVCDYIPSSVGIIAVDSKNINITKKAKLRKRLNKNSLAMFLNRSKLLTMIRKQNKIFTTNKQHRFSNDELRYIVTKNYDIKAIREIAYWRIKESYTPLFQRFLRETNGYSIMIDDIRNLSINLSIRSSFND